MQNLVLADAASAVTVLTSSAAVDDEQEQQQQEEEDDEGDTETDTPTKLSKKQQRRRLRRIRKVQRQHHHHHDGASNNNNNSNGGEHESSTRMMIDIMKDETQQALLEEEGEEYRQVRLKQEAWLKAQFIDDYYRSVPIRPSTITVAKEYAASVGEYHVHVHDDDDDDDDDASSDEKEQQQQQQQQEQPPQDADDLPSLAAGVFPGTHKYLGGAKDDRDGVIYGIPAHARSLICLVPNNNTSTEKTTKEDDNKSSSHGYSIRIDPLPSSVADTKFKWLRGIIAHGYLYGIPAWADCVLEVDIDALWGRRPLAPDRSSPIHLIPLPNNHNFDKDAQWKWHGAAMDPDQRAIYAIPSNAQVVLKVDLQSHSTSYIPIDVNTDKYSLFDLSMTNKWYGGIPGADGAVYGMPYRTCAVLRIDPTTDTAQLVGPQHSVQQFNWHGGLRSPQNGMIYAFPSHADTVLKIDTNPSSGGEICTKLPIHRAPYDTDTRHHYKWLGGSFGADGNIYSMPADASSILKINVTNDYCSTFGFVGSSKNKWQGGVLASTDQCIYAIPADGQHILRIDTSTSTSTTTTSSNKDDDCYKDHGNPYQLLGNLPPRKDKWQGAFIGVDGAMYAIPEGGYRILKVTPSAAASVVLTSSAGDTNVQDQNSVPTSSAGVQDHNIDDTAGPSSPNNKKKKIRPPSEAPNDIRIDML